MELVIRAMTLVRAKLVEGLALTGSTQPLGQRQRMVLLELKAWGLLKEHGSKVDLSSGKQDHRNHLCRRSPLREKGRKTLRLLFLFT